MPTWPGSTSARWSDSRRRRPRARRPRDFGRPWRPHLRRTHRRAISLPQGVALVHFARACRGPSLVHRDRAIFLPADYLITGRSSQGVPVGRRRRQDGSAGSRGTGPLVRTGVRASPSALVATHHRARLAPPRSDHDAAAPERPNTRADGHARARYMDDLAGVTRFVSGH